MANYKLYHLSEKSRKIGHPVNQDNYMFFENRFLNDERVRFLVVADGMGAYEKTEQASLNAVKGFIERVNSRMTDLYLLKKGDISYSLEYHMDTLSEIMIDAVCYANQKVCDAAEDMVVTGTTLSAVCIVGNRAIIVNVGDSPVYYYNSAEEKLSIVNELHSKAAREAAEGLYERYSPEYFRYDNQLYRCLGMKELREEEVSVAELGRLSINDVILIGTDGAFGELCEQEILDILKEKKINQVLGNLFEEARQTKNDDQTAILYKIAE